MGCHDSGRAPPGLAVSASCASFLLPAPVSFRSRRRRVPGQHPLSRVPHVRARLRLRRRGFARLIARARASARRTSPVRSVGAFFAPARNRRRSGLRMPLPRVSFYHGFFRVKPLERNYFAISRTRPASRQIVSRPAAGRAGTVPGRRLRAAAPRSSRAAVSAGARPGRKGRASSTFRPSPAVMACTGPPWCSRAMWARIWRHWAGVLHRARPGRRESRLRRGRRSAPKAASTRNGARRRSWTCSAGRCPAMPWSPPTAAPTGSC